MNRRYFNFFQAVNTNLEQFSTVIAPRPDHVVRLRGYRLEIAVQAITYSTTATWSFDYGLLTTGVDLGNWTLAGETLPSGVVIDVHRFDGGVGRVVTEGGYLIKHVEVLGPVYTDIEVPSIFAQARRTEGLDQTWTMHGWVDFDWVKADLAKLAAVNLAWNVQLAART